MNNLAGLKSFIKENCTILIFTVAIFFVTLFSLSTLTTRPKLWVDEALTMELSHNFSKTGSLNVETSPGEFYEYPYLLQSTGYPLTALLALVFKIFGYSLAVERFVMLDIMILALFAVYFFGQKFFDRDKAVLAVLLFTTFASFYGSGRAGVGEVPGFIFLITSLYLLLIKESYYSSGLFLGLAVAVKPSVFLLALPAIIFTIFTEDDLLASRFKKLIKFLSISALPILAWIFLVIGNPFSVSVWNNILNFYENPYHSTSISFNFINNLLNFFHSSTLIYFSALFLVICVARYYLEDGSTGSPQGKKLKLFYNFVISYSVLAFVYYLRSPGWLRYILIAELLTLFVLPHAMSVFLERFDKQKFAVAVVFLLCLVQFTHLFSGAEIYAGDAASKTARYINETYPGQSIGIINSLEVSSLIQTDEKYQTFTLLGLPTIGTDFFAKGVRPGVVIYGSDTNLSVDAESIIKDYYRYIKSMNGLEVFGLIK
ncbi:MAG: glycosyltransferase family 39 protein [bacterium]|nr:glycosyltransferase family 39 protein [bacterium]